MGTKSVPRIRPAIIPRWRWNQLEKLCLLTEKAVNLAHLNPKRGLPIAAGCAELLGTSARAAAWRAADDLEDWEKKDESQADEDAHAPAAEVCVVEVRLCEQDRRAMAEFTRATSGVEAKVQ